MKIVRWFGVVSMVLALTGLIAFGYVQTMKGVLYHYDKEVWSYVLEFRCELSRWPRDSVELVDKATLQSKPDLQHYLGRMGGIRFSNNNQDLAAKTIHIRFVSQSGYVDETELSYDKAGCEETPNLFARHG